MATRFPIETNEPTIEVDLPVGTHVLELIVEDSAGLRSEPDIVTIVVVGIPAITDINPKRGVPGDQVILTGQNFVNVQQVVFGAAVAQSFNVDSDTQITAIVPQDAWTGRIRVIAQEEEAVSPDDFVVEHVTIEIDPPVVEVDQGGAQQFTANVGGTSNTDVNWTVSAGGGTIDGNGLYTAPDSPGEFEVTATSAADQNVAASATVTIPEISITIVPPAASILVGKQKRFTAEVAGTVNTAVEWSVQGGDANGTITAGGTYTAPNEPGLYTVNAQSTANSSKTASADVTVDEVSIKITPVSANILPGQTQKFTATVTGMTEKAVTWSIVEGASGGSIDNTGLYTAPSPANTTEFHVLVTSDADPRVKLQAPVTVEVVQVTAISPASATLDQGAAQQFSATVAGTLSKGVQWAATKGAVAQNGSYQAPASAGVDTVTATSQRDPSKSKSASVTVRSVAINIRSHASSVSTGGKIQFEANVTGTTNHAKHWFASAGSINESTGLFTAPSSVTTVTITVEADANRGAEDTTSISVTKSKDKEKEKEKEKEVKDKDKEKETKEKEKELKEKEKEFKEREKFKDVEIPAPATPMSKKGEVGMVVTEGSTQDLPLDGEMGHAFIRPEERPDVSGA